VVSSPAVFRFSLRKDLGFWQLTFKGQQAIIKHEQGLNYVAYLLLNPPPEPIHALVLATRILAFHRIQAALTEVVDPATGRFTPIESDAQLQQRSLALDDAMLTHTVLRRQNELEAILEDQTTIEPVRAEVERELIDLYRYGDANSAKIRDSACRCVRAVTMAIKRLHTHLATACCASGQPHAVLRAFAAHLLQHLLTPSGRYSGGGGGRTRAGVAGRFTYEPPKGVIWRS
jgi:hypothetical protein